MRSLSIALLLLGLVALWSGLARALPEPEADSARARARHAMQQAEQAERELRFREAWVQYTRAFELDPSAPFAPSARSRASWLQQRSEGEFARLTSAQQVARDPAAMRDPARIRALHQEAIGFPPGPVRVETLLLVADASIRLLNRPGDAEEAWLRVLEDAAAGGPERAIALNGVVELSLSRGELAEAAARVRTWGDAAPLLRAKVQRLQRRSYVVRAAVAVLILVLVAALVAAARIGRRSGLASVRALVPWWAVAFGLYLAIGGAALAHAHEHADLTPFLVLGPGTSLLLCAVRAWRIALPQRGWRIAAAVLGALGVVALAALALQTSRSLAEGFGL